MNIVEESVLESKLSFTWKPEKIFNLSSDSSSCPMLIHTSVYTTFAPDTASYGFKVTEKLALDSRDLLFISSTIFVGIEYSGGEAITKSIHTLAAARASLTATILPSPM